jgi:23S rRNA pseudouridine2604 synthase
MGKSLDICYDIHMIEKPSKSIYPMRINKYLSQKGVVSRREADKLIETGKVRINGKTAVLGDRVNEKDEVVVDQKTLAQKEAAYVYLAFNKPIGVVTNPEVGQKSIADMVKYKTPLTPMGRLDKESHGLIILTNDTRVTGRLLESENEHDKEYHVTVNKKLTPMFQKEITSGMRLEDFTAKPCKLVKISPTEFFLTLTEGKKHQIRRMCSALGYDVEDLQRVRIMNIKLNDLKDGQVRQIVGQEKENFLKQLGL